MENSFLDYAMSVIMSRALPDVRDGLKPVHRRIIWDMEDQGFRPDRRSSSAPASPATRWPASTPTATAPIYDALVRMAQPFSLRHPLIDFHGNYGSPDFGPAAMRYTECRLHPLAMQLLADIDEDTVDMVAELRRANEEPIVLPARFPNLLVNGSQGIAVGMATNIPPHNLGEVIDATIHLIDHPGGDARRPDGSSSRAPTSRPGASILGRAGIMDAYRTGRGSVKMRATATIEENKRGATEIVVTELPYQTSCSAIAARIQELVDAGDLEGIADVNDGSSGGKTELVITLQARRQRQRRAQQAVQADAAADELPDQHGRPRRRRAAHAQPARRRWPATSATRSTSSRGARSSGSTRPAAASTSSRAGSRRSTSSTRSSP